MELFEQVRPGIRVYSVSDFGIGEVTGVNVCCFDLTDRRGAAHHVVPAAIFVLNDDKLTLICEADGLSRHACHATTHPPRP